MIDPKLLRSNLPYVIEKLNFRGEKVTEDTLKTALSHLDDLRNQSDILRHKRNQFAKEIASLQSQKKDITNVKVEASKVSRELKQLAQLESKAQDQWDGIQLALPNLPSDQTPDGLTEADNIAVKAYDQNGLEKDPNWTPSPSQGALGHLEVGQKLGQLRFDLGAKLSGSNFSVMTDELALLNRALSQFMVEENIKAGYRLCDVPSLVLASSMTSSGQLPKFEDQAFKTTDDKYLAPTSEVQLVNIYQGQLLDQSDLPIKMTAHTPCFRKEAGSYGKEVSGLVRMHQFEKVEVVQIVKPEDSNQALLDITNQASYLLTQLGLTHRVLELCAGELGFAATRTFDLEVWLPGANMYREISSCSNCLDFQARRGKIRFKEDKANTFAHTLNGSALALSRTLVAILEQYQTADGINIPKILQPRLGFDKILYK